MCLETLDWEPSQVVEVEKVAREIGITPSLNGLTEYVVGGRFCHRATLFGDSTVPSTVALTHHAIRTTLFYEAVVKMRNLRAPVAGEKRKYDRDDADAEERFRRKAARMDCLKRAYDRDDGNRRPRR